jgi:hypothetical protein
MRIAIDARELSGRPTGVGRYVAELLRAWDTIPGALTHEFVLCAAGPITTPPITRLRVTAITAKGGGPWWEQRVLPRLVRQTGADVLFAPAYSGPLFPGVPMVVTVHDVSFAAHPEWFAPKEGFRRRLATRLAARRARRVLTVSGFSKREIVRCFGIDPAKVDVVYSGATPFPADVSDGGSDLSAVALAKAEDPDPHLGRSVGLLRAWTSTCSTAPTNCSATSMRCPRRAMPTDARWPRCAECSTPSSGWSTPAPGTWRSPPTT